MKQITKKSAFKASAMIMFMLILLSCLTFVKATDVDSIAVINENKSYSWYCVHRYDGEQPVCDAEMAFLIDHGGYYIDRHHTDMNDSDKVIYLTFDAGYENGNIEKILDIMKEEGVTGAFFVLENLVKQNGDLVKRMADEGHFVCNHTAHHKNMTKITEKAAFASEIRQLEDECLEYTGISVKKYYRPPEGKFSMQNLDYARELGYKTILWSFAYADWDNNNQMSNEKAIEKIISGTHNGEVILLHPTSDTNAAILKELIKEWKNMGFSFGTLDDLTGDV